jgi:hypothetical protein
MAHVFDWCSIFNRTFLTTATQVFSKFDLFFIIIDLI